MNRAVTSFVLLFTFLAFTTIGSAGGLQPSGEQMAHFSWPAATSKNQQDRCQMTSSCQATCLQCAAGMPAEIADLAAGTSVKAKRHRTLARRSVSERLYRPPRV